ncbi:hypothetical protein CPB86DRAFT_708674 [Serendipita vermifera]|nr:hypothetical protein CPB86DRAFT_708674 [Serendipita vermifera]
MTTPPSNSTLPAGTSQTTTQPDPEASTPAPTLSRFRSRHRTIYSRGKRYPVIPANSRPAIAQEECIVCRGEQSYFPQNAPTTNCEHSSEVCHDCLRRTIEAAVQNRNFGGENGQGIKCPTISCTQWMEHSDVKQWADSAVFQRYDSALLLSTLEGQEGYIPCLNPECRMGQIHTGEDDNPVVICHSCGAKQCWIHRIPWHEGYTCKQWNKKSKRDKREDRASSSYILTTTKGCPNPKCGRRIEKSHGCDHMTCKRPAGCGHQFCWVCLAPWDLIREHDNSRHYDDCQYYSGPPGGNPAPPHLKASRMKRKKWWQIWVR